MKKKYARRISLWCVIIMITVELFSLNDWKFWVIAVIMGLCLPAYKKINRLWK